MDAFKTPFPLAPRPIRVLVILVLVQGRRKVAYNAYVQVFGRSVIHEVVNDSEEAREDAVVTRNKWKIESLTTERIDKGYSLLTAITFLT